MDVRGKVAVVTGAASGIGYALAASFAADGAKVVFADVHGDVCEEAAAAVAAETGAEVLAVPTDVSDPAAVDALAAATIERFGAVHVVCNNAGLLAMGHVWDLTLEEWHRVLDVNLWGVVHGIRSFVPLLLAHDEPGYVVNTASMAALMTIGGLAPYTASKHAVLGITETLAHDLDDVGAGDRIGVSVLCPGMVPSRLGFDDRRAPIREPGRTELSADQVAAQVREAMAARRFYVLTHEGSAALATQRTDAVADGMRPFGMPLPQP
jgi:NAD(P)-dependent dehydrogenase (short-subunit alcohol dehydrogenase family)